MVSGSSQITNVITQTYVSQSAAAAGFGGGTSDFNIFDLETAANAQFRYQKQARLAKEFINNKLNEGYKSQNINNICPAGGFIIRKNSENIKIIKRMAPFGLGNKRPVFRTNNCFIDSKLKFLGKEDQIVKSKIKDKNVNLLKQIYKIIL